MIGKSVSYIYGNAKFSQTGDEGSAHGVCTNIVKSQLKTTESQ
jgi:hypothetical protein